MPQATITKWVDALCRRASYDKAIALLNDRVRQFPDERWAADLLAQVRLKAQQGTRVVSLGADGFDDDDADFIDDLDEAGDEWSLEDVEPGAAINAPAVEAAETQDDVDAEPESGVEELQIEDESSDSEFDAGELDLLPDDGDEWADLDVTVSEVESKAIAWDEGEDPTPPVDPEILGSGRMELERRARISAARLIPEIEWLRRDLPLIQEILAYHRCHSKTIAALRDLIPLWGVLPSELRTAFQLRIYWAECDHFHRGWNSSDELAAVTWQNISWGLSLAIVRHLGSDDVDETTDWLHSCFDDWVRWHIKGRYHPTFHSYLVSLLSHLDAQEQIIGHRLPAYIDFDLFAEEAEPLSGTPLWRALDDFGLFPKRLVRPCNYSDNELAKFGEELPRYVFIKGQP